jgi:hypothetical protein
MYPRRHMSRSLIKLSDLYRKLCPSILGGVTISVLAIRPNVRGLNLAEAMVFLRAIQIRSKPFFGGGVKPSASCRKILRNIEITWKWTKMLCKDKFIIPFARSSWLLPDDCLCNFQRALGDEWGFLICRRHSTGTLHAHTSSGGWRNGPYLAADHRGSLTPLTWSSSQRTVITVGFSVHTISSGAFHVLYNIYSYDCSSTHPLFRKL